MTKHLRTAASMEKGLGSILDPVHTFIPRSSDSIACRPVVRQYITAKVMAARKQKRAEVSPGFKPTHNLLFSTRPYLLKSPATSTTLGEPLVHGLWGAVKTQTMTTKRVSYSRVDYECQNTLVHGVVQGKSQWLSVPTHETPGKGVPLGTAMPAQC